MTSRQLREIVTAVGALIICVACITIGTWIFLRVSGAGEELRRLQNAAAATPPSGAHSAGPAVDVEAMMAAWSLPVMLGVLGSAALCTGVWVGVMSRSRVSLIAIVGIMPLYVIAFATGLNRFNLIWAGLYTVLAIGTAYAIGALRSKGSHPAPE